MTQICVYYILSQKEIERVKIKEKRKKMLKTRTMNDVDG